MFNDTIRPRRLRTSDSLRRLVRETRMSLDSLIWPVFVAEGEGIYREIESLPGQYHYSPDQLYRMVERAHAHGVSRVILFGLPKDKDECGSGAWAENGIVQQGIRKIKELSHAQAGADMVAPSDMMDGRVAAIREILDNNGFQNVPVMAYSAKFASYFYGPFREAAGSTPSFGDRRSYQMDPHNGREAMRECELDVLEGADILMVKPALAYLDLVHEARQRFDLPIACYAVSGEYAMVKAAAKAGLIDEYGVMCESAVCMYRAGADILITYYACELADAIRKGDIG